LEGVLLGEEEVEVEAEVEDEAVVVVGGGGNLRRASVVGVLVCEKAGMEMDTTGRAMACFFSPRERVLCSRTPAPPCGTIVLRNRGLPPLPTATVPLPFAAAGGAGAPKAAERRDAGPRDEDCENVDVVVENDDEEDEGELLVVEVRLVEAEGRGGGGEAGFSCVGLGAPQKSAAAPPLVIILTSPTGCGAVAPHEEEAPLLEEA
jgi:hypothetical protein